VSSGRTSFVTGGRSPPGPAASFGESGSGGFGQAGCGRAPLGRAASSTRLDAGEVHQGGQARGQGRRGQGRWARGAGTAAPAMEVGVGVVVVGWVGEEGEFF
jgi:hypothetical protein